MVSWMINQNKKNQQNSKINFWNDSKLRTWFRKLELDPFEKQLQKRSSLCGGVHWWSCYVSLLWRWQKKRKIQNSIPISTKNQPKIKCPSKRKKWTWKNAFQVQQFKTLSSLFSFKNLEIFSFSTNFSPHLLFFFVDNTRSWANYGCWTW